MTGSRFKEVEIQYFSFSKYSELKIYNPSSFSFFHFVSVKQNRVCNFEGMSDGMSDDTSDYMSAADTG